jgi:hypothetical protein
MIQPVMSALCDEQSLTKYAWKVKTSEHDQHPLTQRVVMLRIPGSAIRAIVLVGAFVPVLLSTRAASAEPTVADRAAQSRKAVQNFADRLKGELVAAMKAGGPEAAIGVCFLTAPAIAKDVSQATGWSVGRTALKVRNPMNAPDAWERAVLEDFVIRAKKGSDLKALEHYEVTTHEDKRVFRYMKAIPTGKVCLTCHGSNLNAGLYEKIKEYYQDDQATGFKLGELRGAFTIIQPIK